MSFSDRNTAHYWREYTQLGFYFRNAGTAIAASSLERTDYETGLSSSDHKNNLCSSRTAVIALFEAKVNL